MLIFTPGISGLRPPASLDPERYTQGQHPVHEGAAREQVPKRARCLCARSGSERTPGRRQDGGRRKGNSGLFIKH